MQVAQVPPKIPRPWADSADTLHIRAIPDASQIGTGQPGAASWTDGFPPLNFTPVAAGGTPPWGQDANGVLNQMSAWLRWLGAGAPVQWDSAFSTLIGGYPAGAVVQSTVSIGLFWLCLVDDNPNNPDTGGAGWISWTFGGDTTRIQTASGAFVTSATDVVVGLNRTTSVAVSSTSLPTGVSVGKRVVYEDLAGNFNAFPLTVSPPGGMTIAGQTTAVANVNRQSITFRFYGSNIWSVGR